MSHHDNFDEDTPISQIPLNIEGARDLDEATAAELAEAVAAARNVEELR